MDENHSRMIAGFSSTEKVARLERFDFQ